MSFFRYKKNVYPLIAVAAGFVRDRLRAGVRKDAEVFLLSSRRIFMANAVRLL